MTKHILTALPASASLITQQTTGQTVAAGDGAVDRDDVIPTDARRDRLPADVAAATASLFAEIPETAMTDTDRTTMITSAPARRDDGVLAVAAELQATMLICTPQGIAIAPAPLRKVCGKCHKEQSIACFNREKRKRDGFSAWCKRCKSHDQTRRRETRLKDDEDWQLRRKTYARLTRLIEAGEVHKPTACPLCGSCPKPREIQASFADPADPRTVLWRCRACALAAAGKTSVAICRWCEEPFVAQRTMIRRGGARYCSVRCRNAWMRKTAEHVHRVAPGERTTAETVFMQDRF